MCSSSRINTNTNEKGKVSAKKPPLPPSQFQGIVGGTNLLAPPMDCSMEKNKPESTANNEIKKLYNVIQPRQNIYSGITKEEENRTFPDEIMKNKILPTKQNLYHGALKEEISVSPEEISRKTCNLPKPELFDKLHPGEELARTALESRLFEREMPFELKEKNNTNKIGKNSFDNFNRSPIENKEKNFIENYEKNSFDDRYKNIGTGKVLDRKIINSANNVQIENHSDKKNNWYLAETENKYPECLKEQIFSNLLSKFNSTIKKNNNEELQNDRIKTRFLVPSPQPQPQQPFPKPNFEENGLGKEIPPKKMPNPILKKPSSSLKRMPSKDYFPPPNPTLIQKLFEWLISINLFKENIKINQEKLPKICKNGVIFADIINRMESRHEVLTGINRKPKKTAEMHANYTKIFDFLSKHEKMNKRCLYSYASFLGDDEDNSNAFWALMDDIWHFYHSKMSKYDSRYQETKKIPAMNESKRLHSSIKRTEVSNTSYEEIICSIQNEQKTNISTNKSIYFWKYNYKLYVR